MALVEILVGDRVVWWANVPAADELAKLAKAHGLAEHPFASTAGIIAEVLADLRKSPEGHDALQTEATKLLNARTKAPAAKRAAIDATRDDVAKVILETYPNRRAHEGWRAAIEAGQHVVRIDGVVQK